MLSGIKLSSIQKLSSIWTWIQTWARNLKRDGVALYLASRDPRVPWYAKALAVAIAAYALSPIDLIPDFIPVIGYLDDLILLPLGIRLAIALMPPEIMADCRTQANALLQRPISRAGMIAIFLLWIAGALALAWAVFTHWPRWLA